MDRRIKKTREAIFSAFSALLSKKRYSQITVQEIIDEANIGRSTFYAHFETKDELLSALCRDMFEHVFSDDLVCELSHNFADNKKIDAKITHILYHLKDSRRDIKSILTHEGSEVFLTYFKQYLERLFTLSDDFTTAQDIPEDFILNHMVGSFVEAVKWWLKNDMRQTPEQIARYFLGVQKL